MLMSASVATSPMSSSAFFARSPAIAILESSVAFVLFTFEARTLLVLAMSPRFASSPMALSRRSEVSDASFVNLVPSAGS